MKTRLLFLTTTLLIAISSYAQTSTIADGNWSNPAIWSAGVPTSTTDATVNHAVTIDINSSVRSLTVSSSGSITNSNRDLEIYDNLSVATPTTSWIESGTGKTVLRGTSSSISGQITFNRLNVTKNRKDGPHIVTLNDTIFVSKYFYLNRGTVNASSFPLVLLGNSTTDGNLGYSPEGNLTGDLIWRKYIDRCNEWSTYSTPGSNPTLTDIASASGGRMIYTGFPDSDFPTFSFVNTYFYDEVSGYAVPTSTSNTLARGQGYWYWNSNEVSNSEMPSIPQQWTIQLILDGFANNTFNFNVTNSSDGFNLVGNPYPGVLDWNHGSWSRTNIDNAIYYWNTCTQSYASYINGVGSNGGDQWIPAGQGFWVQATGSNPAMSVRPAALSIGTLSAKPLKNGENENEIPYLSFILNGDETVVRFDNNSTTEYDNGFDAKKLLAPSFVNDNSSVRTVLNGINYSVNTVPSEDIIIPLEVKGQGELSFDGANNFPEIEIYLQDLATNELRDMKVYKTYNFTNIESSFTHRFNIIVKSTGNLAVKEVSSNKMSVYPNPFSSNITIMTNGEIFDKVEVYNILGELVMTEINNGSSPKQINVSELNSGAYIIKVYNQGGEIGTFLTQKN